MFADFKLASNLSTLFLWVDHHCRKEVAAGVLVSERDYVSRLCGLIRDFAGDPAMPDPVWSHAQTVPPQQEQAFGVDGIVVFQHKNQIKVGLFEAKWPRLAQSNYTWDYRSSRQISHFSEQLEKQKQLRDVVALWELFILEGPEGQGCLPLQAFGSACVWHDPAYAFMQQEGLIFNSWTSEKLRLLLRQSSTNLRTVVYDILTCQAGVPLTIDPRNLTARVIIEATNVSLPIPLPTQPVVDGDQRIGGFMREYGLQSYLYVNLG